MPPSKTQHSLRALINDSAKQLLQKLRVDDASEARLEAELLYAEAAGLQRAQVIARGTESPDTAARQRFENLLERRLKGAPLAYITGTRHFYGISYLVGPGALIPRPETETLVEATLAAVREHPETRRQVRVIDVGTGPGTVALTVALHAQTAIVVAIDASTAALAWANRNRRRLNLMDRVELLVGDLLEPLTDPIDVVVANLPYIPSDELAGLPIEIRKAEPVLAVDGGEDGLVVIRRLITQLTAHLAKGPCAVLLEVGAGQAAFVEDLLREALGHDIELTRHRDLRGTARVVEARQSY